jgi:hypothetical protein
MPSSGRVAIIASPHSTRMTIGPARPRRCLAIRPARQKSTKQAGPFPRLHPKLLNMRDFRGFPLATKRRYNSLAVNGQRAVGLAYFHRYGFSSQNAPLARPGFVPTCFRPIHDVVLSRSPLGNALPPAPLPAQTRKRMRRGYLHHHLPGAGGLHFPASA